MLYFSFYFILYPNLDNILPTIAERIINSNTLLISATVVYFSSSAHSVAASLQCSSPIQLVTTVWSTLYGSLCLFMCNTNKYHLFLICMIHIKPALFIKKIIHMLDL